MEFKKVHGEGPERIQVAMLDPILAPGSSKTANAPITAKPSEMSCEAEIFLGPDPNTKSATSGRKPFTSTGVSQTVSLPVIMPTPAAGEGAAYHVYIDVYAGSIKFLAYIATEDVVIPGGSIGPITWT